MVAATGALAVALLALAWSERGGGRVLFGIAGIAAAVECVRGATLRPTVEVVDDGVRVAHGLWRREHVSWQDLDAAEMQRRSRRGATAKWLELDTGDRLITVPGYRLGAPVAEVLAAIQSARAAGTAQKA